MPGGVPHLRHRELAQPAQGVQAGLGALPRDDAVAPQDGARRAPQPDQDHHDRVERPHPGESRPDEAQRLPRPRRTTPAVEVGAGEEKAREGEEQVHPERARREQRGDRPEPRGVAGDGQEAQVVDEDPHRGDRAQPGQRRDLDGGRPTDRGRRAGRRSAPRRRDVVVLPHHRPHRASPTSTGGIGVRRPSTWLTAPSGRNLILRSVDRCGTAVRSGITRGQHCRSPSPCHERSSHRRVVVTPGRGSASGPVLRGLRAAVRAVRAARSCRIGEAGASGYFSVASIVQQCGP